MLIATVFLIVIFVLAVAVGGDWGETAALAFSLIWLGFFRKRTFAVGLSLCSAFAIMAIAAAFGSSLANAFGDGVFGAAVIMLFTLRNRPPSEGLSVLVVARNDTDRAGDAAAFPTSLFLYADREKAPVRFVVPTFDQGDAPPQHERTSFFRRNPGWFSGSESALAALDIAAVGIAAADERNVDVIYGVGAIAEIYAAIAIGVATGRPVVGHFDRDVRFARYPRGLATVTRMWLSNARFIVSDSRATIDAVTAIGYPAARCVLLAASSDRFDELVALFASAAEPTAENATMAR